MDIIEKQIILIECIIIYGILNRIIFGGKLRRYWIAVIAPIIYGTALFFLQGRGSFVLLMLGVLYISYGVMMCESIRNRIFRLLMITILFFALNETLDAVLQLCGLYMSESYTIRLIQNHLIFILLLSILAFITRKSRSVDAEDVISYRKEKTIYVIVLVMSGAVYMNVSLMHYLMKYVQNDKLTIFYHIISIISLLSIVVMFFMVKHIIAINKVTGRLLESEKQLNEMQEIYYKTLLEREEHTRKIIHDVKAHMLCLENLAYNGDTEAVKEYVGNMHTEMSSAAGKRYYSGNDMVDILLNFYLSQVGEKVDVNVLGRWDNQMNISRNGICTICSNLLKNAVEEVKRCEENGYIVVKLTKGKQYSQIEVRNSISQKHKNLSKWNPQEEKNHGYGLKNVQEVVEKNNGSMEIEASEIEYKITICF